MRRFRRKILLVFCCLAAASLALFACAKDQKSSPGGGGGGDAPLDTLMAYNEAIKKGDAAKMKSLLSRASLKMAEEEARAQNAPVDEILKRQTLYSPGQTTVKYQKQKIEGERASLEVKNSYGTWDVIPFIREDGKWKIAKELYAEELLRQAEEDSRRLDEESNRARQQP